MKIFIPLLDQQVGTDGVVVEADVDVLMAFVRGLVPGRIEAAQVEPFSHVLSAEDKSPPRT